MLALPDRQKWGNDVTYGNIASPLALDRLFFLSSIPRFGQADDDLYNLHIGTQNFNISQYIQLKICLFQNSKG